MITKLDLRNKKRKEERERRQIYDARESVQENEVSGRASELETYDEDV
jgi:hypothetical protein